MSAFSATYAAARAQFLGACLRCGADDIAPYLHPLRGAEGEMLGTDAAWFGPRDARAVLVLISATHGVEGFCGSAIQIDWIERAAHGDSDIGVLCIHALNPHGFSWLRRVNEYGVDLNRNFVDFSKPLPQNPGYAQLHDALLPARIDDESLRAADAVLDAYRIAHGERALEQAVTGGQYSHIDGLFFGGTGPSWSRRTVEAIIDDFALRARDVVSVIDIHTGLGPFGYGEIICDHPTGSAELERGRRWFGDSLTEPALGTSTSVPKRGLLDYGWMDALGPVVTFVTLEFGTYPVDEMFRRLRADHVLHRGGLPDWHAPATQEIKSALKRHFYPDDEGWRAMVLERGRDVIAQACDGLRAAI